MSSSCALRAAISRTHGHTKHAVHSGASTHPVACDPAGAHRMGGDAAFRIRDGNGAELHAGARRGPRNVETISPRIASAISAGETAPMSSPIGAWMRCVAAASVSSSCHARQVRGRVLRVGLFFLGLGLG